MPFSGSQQTRFAFGMGGGTRPAGVFAGKEAFLFSSAGIRPGWYSISDLQYEELFHAQARIEANGNAVWAYWRPGAPRGSANLKLNLALIEQEAESNATWARWAPGVQTGNVSGNLQLDIHAALAANFVLS